MTTTKGASPTTSPRLTPRLRTLLVTLIPTMLSIYLVWGAYGVVLAAQVEDVVGSANKEASYGIVATVGAVLALFAQPLAGILSDRTRTRFGRRGPFLIGAPLVAAVGFIGLGTANTLFQIAASWFVLQIALNFTQGPLTAVLPDRVPTERRGLFSTVLGLGGGLGLMVGQVIGSMLVPQYLLVWCLLGGIIVVALVTFALVNPEGSNRDRPREPFDLRSFLGSFWVSPRRHPDFAWAFLGRMFVNFGFMLVSMYLLYVLQEYIGLDRPDALEMVATLGVVSAAATVPGMLIAGPLSDKLGRRKIFIILCCVFIAAGLVVAWLWPTPTGMIVYMAIASFGNGMFTSVDIALIADVLPNQADAGKDIGIVNIKRSPRGGRSFEYFSEDPLVSSRFGTEWVRGVQGLGIGASLKHFAANSQETERLRIDMRLSPRALREIELRAFEPVVREAKPWTVMCAYNRVNGVFAAENRELLTGILRDEWGFDGVVVSDWGAVHDRVEGIRAGLELEMPASGGVTVAEIERAVKRRELTAADLDRAVSRMLRLVRRSVGEFDAAATFDAREHHDLARRIAAEAVVLLKNERGLLPLAGDVAVIGELARTPRYQGAGSSQIVPTMLDDALSEIRAEIGEVPFAAGYALDGAADRDADELRREAAQLAARAGTAVVFLGLPASAESEGYDRDDLELPAEQLALLDAVLAETDRVVVVLSHGGVVTMRSWVDRVPAVVDGSLLGQGGGWALAQVLTGRVNPSGRIAETVPRRIEDASDWLSFPGEELVSPWDEGVFVGYRWYDARDLEVEFPFGHGLSYTRFRYGAPRAEVAGSGSDQRVIVRVAVTNAGEREGSEVVQVYAAAPSSRVRRAVRELRGFDKVALAPGETREVEVSFPAVDFGYWSERHGRFIVEAGRVRVDVGASSRDIRGSVELEIAGDEPRPELTVMSPIAEWMADPVLGADVTQAIDATGMDREAQSWPMVAQTPMKNITMMPGMGASALAVLDQMLKARALAMDGHTVRAKAARAGYLARAAAVMVRAKL